MNFEKPEKWEFWKNENICWRYHHFTHVYQKPRRRQNFLSFWAIFCPFTTPFPLQPKKPKFWKMKKTSGNVIISNILNLCNKKYDHMKQSAKDKHFRPFFALLPHYWPRKLKFGKNVKNTWRYYPFTHVYHKSRSYDVWFLRYKVQRTGFFVILSHFCLLSFLTTQEIKILK